MLEKNDRAFKEWAVIVRALLAGRQSIIIRKGGIAEEGGSFAVEDKEFFLFSTYVHQQESGVIPEERVDLKKLQAEAPPGGMVAIPAYVTVEEIFEVSDLERAKTLRGEHIWADRVIEDRFVYGIDSGLYILLVRVYRLPEPVHFPMLEVYGGCKSWVTLEHPLSTAGAAPVLDDHAFSRESTTIRRMLADGT